MSGLLKAGAILVTVFLSFIKAFPHFMGHSKYGVGLIFTTTGGLGLGYALLFERKIVQDKPDSLTGAAAIWFLIFGLSVIVFTFFR